LVHWQGKNKGWWVVFVLILFDQGRGWLIWAVGPAYWAAWPCLVPRRLRLVIGENSKINNDRGEKKGKKEK
jgi:hypothetical protein